ncbi:MAG: molybdopterin-synthase adenylyltransferase MoeB [Rhodocyclaceae bacterium]|nr:molybdopterin-synthase adenylyltransferase MoeB [Rhodocyclaceae bacterium]
MTDDELLRYSRHILLPEIDIAGQDAIRGARVLIIGIGGLGSPAALYLASAGIGTIVLADGDTVDLTNLQRQILHRTDSVGLAKVESGRRTICEINPTCNVIAIAERLEGEALTAQIALADVVLDCSDNFATRHAVNRACVAKRKPLVSGAAIRFDGQISVFDSRQTDAPCYECLFPEGENVEDVRCATMGVFAPITGIIGAMQAAEALKLIVGCGVPLTGRLELLDGTSMTWREIRIRRDPQCRVCAQ